jgi:hypothetical protein
MKFTFLILLVAFSAVFGPAQPKKEIPKGWTEFANDSFSFYAPKTLKKQEVRGIDSFVGEYRSDNLTVKFDYGWYGNTAGNCPQPVSATVYGKAAKICLYENAEIDKDKKYVTAIVFANLDARGQTKLTFWVLSKTKESQKEAEKIVRSIKFK